MKHCLESKRRPSKALKETMSKGVVDRNVKSKEVFKTIQGLRKKPKPSKLKKFTKAVGKGALVGGAVASGLEYKRRKDRGDYKE